MQKNVYITMCLRRSAEQDTTNQKKKNDNDNVIDISTWSFSLFVKQIFTFVSFADISGLVFILTFSFQYISYYIRGSGQGRMSSLGSDIVWNIK